MKKYKRILFEDRKRIEEALKEGKRVSEIADAIGVHPVTVYGELRRCPGEYNAEQAQRTL